MTKKILTSMIALALLAGVSEAQAQTSVNASASITINQVLYLDVAAGGTSIAFSSPAAADYNTGHIAASNTSVITHKGNVPHAVKVTAGAANLAGVGGNTKPASALQWSTDGSTWAGMSTSAADVKTSGRGTGSATVQYRMLLDYATDAPDTYSLSFTYSVVAN